MGSLVFKPNKEEIKEINDGILCKDIPAFFTYKGVNYGNIFTEDIAGKDLRERTLRSIDAKIPISVETFQRKYDNGWFYKLHI